MTREAPAYLGAFLRSPGAESFARLHAELAGVDAVRKEAGRLFGGIQLGHDDVVDVAREIQPDEIGVLHGPKHRKPRSEAVLYDNVNGFRIANATLDEAEGFAPQRILKAVADEARDVAMHFY